MHLILLKHNTANVSDMVDTAEGALVLVKEERTEVSFTLDDHMSWFSQDSHRFLRLVLAGC